MSQSNTALRILSFLPLVTLAVCVVMPDLAIAQEDLSDVSDRLQENITSLKSLALSVMFLIGLVVFGVGIWLFYKDSKQANQGHAKNGFIALIVGALLLSVTTVVGVLGNTVLGSDSEATDNITIDSGF